MTTPAEVRAALAEVLDPEQPVSLIDLGLIRSVDVDGTTARIGVTYCSMGCPCIELIDLDIRERVLQLEGVETVEIDELYEPWSRADISGRGLQLLRQHGVA